MGRKKGNERDEEEDMVEGESRKENYCAGNRLLGSCAVYFWLDSSRFTCPDDGGDTFLRNDGSNQKYTAQDPRRRFPA
jgi:hypothetical protein